MRKYEIRNKPIHYLVEEEHFEEKAQDFLEDGDSAFKLKQLEIQKEIQLEKLKLQQQEQLKREEKEREERERKEERERRERKRTTDEIRTNEI